MCSLKVVITVFFIFFVSFSRGQTDTLSAQNNDSAKIHRVNDTLYKTRSAVSTNKIDRTLPTKWGFIRNVPAGLWQITKTPFQKKNIWKLALVTAGSAILIWQDQPVLNGTKQLAGNIHLSPESDYKVLVKSGNTKIIKIPQNLNSALYQAGEGGTSMVIAGAFFIYGKITHNNRALQTASDLAETFISMGIATQLLKRTFGRQSPFVSTQPGGAWHPFPSFGTYQRYTPEYDAFPSGHLATMMATVTVLAVNYPEKKWIRPLGYTIMALSGLAMMNTDVHWAGDYPLALALGYLSGKITTDRHKKKVLSITGF